MVLASTSGMKKAFICGIQSQETGKFLFLQHPVTKQWQWPSVVDDRNWSVSSMILFIEQILGESAQSFNSFVSHRCHQQTIMHVWSSGEELPLVTDREYQWCYLGEFPRKMDYAIKSVVNSPLFFNHCLEPFGKYT